MVSDDDVMEIKEATVECKSTTHFMLSYNKRDGTTALAYGLVDSVSVFTVQI